jgi:type IV/VI secretion system ImpK/VasF family protein
MTGGAMGVSLREVFTPFFTYVLLLVRSPRQQQRTVATVRGDINRLLDEQRTLVKRHDLTAPDYDAARFAAVAWADELILRSTHDSNREFSQQWKRAPLQVELYNTANAGEEFFDKLTALRPAQKDVREIYHLCLCLGFRGRYYDDAQEYKLIELRRQMAPQLPVPAPDLLELDKQRERVTPQPYTVPAPPARRVGGPHPALWTALALGLAALCAAVIAYLFWPAPHRPQADIIADLRQRLASFQCWQLDAVDFQMQTGIAALAGRVESEEQRQQIHQAAKGVPEVTEVQDTFTVVPRPFCEVLDLLAPVQARGSQARFDLSVRPQKGCATTYYRAENLVVSVNAQKALQYVYVDYYVADRSSVAHLMPNPKQTDNFLKSGTSLTIGDPSSDTQWQVQPPFGMELITVISTPQALFAQRRPPVETVSSYLADLRHALTSTGSGPDEAASYCLITTQER